MLKYVFIKPRQRERLSGSVRSICSSVCLSVIKMQKNAIFSKQFRAVVSIYDQCKQARKSYLVFSKNPLLNP